MSNHDYQALNVSGKKNQPNVVMFMLCVNKCDIKFGHTDSDPFDCHNLCLWKKESDNTTYTQNSLVGVVVVGVVVVGVVVVVVGVVVVVVGVVVVDVVVVAENRRAAHTPHYTDIRHTNMNRVTMRLSVNKTWYHHKKRYQACE